VLSEIASSFVELLARGDSDRLKVCDNPECRFVFYDASKNRSRRWCAHTTCGNRHKVRRFRERQRARARSERPPS
jgi:predicted RNA-binding Zn ribbon-like protein